MPARGPARPAPLLVFRSGALRPRASAHKNRTECGMPIMNLSDALFRNAKVLVIAPHADDETFGCGGTMAKAKALGAQVYVMVVSVADLDHYSEEHAFVTGVQRASEFRRAMDVIGIDGADLLYTDEKVHMRVDV